MKKLLLLIFFLTYSFNGATHMAHYNKFNKIEMEILKMVRLLDITIIFLKKIKMKQ